MFCVAISMAARVSRRDKRAGFDSLLLLRFREPGLEHEDVPQAALPVVGPGQMFRPLSSYRSEERRVGKECRL